MARRCPSWPRSPGARAWTHARLRRRGELWTATTVAHVVPFLVAGVALVALQPLALPVALACVAHAWVIPELYAARGANVVRPPRRTAQAGEGPEATALGLLGDLVGHDARDLHARTGLVLEPGRLGTWLVGPAGALLVRRGRLGRPRVDCWCVGVPDPEPAHGRPHLAPPAGAPRRRGRPGHGGQPRLLGRAWRVRRRLDPRQRPALAAAVVAA